MSTPNWIANGNILPSRFVKIDVSRDYAVLQAGAGDTPIGVSQESGREPPLPNVSTMNAAQAGDNLRVYGDTETCLLQIGGTVAAGDKLKPNASGQGITTVTANDLYGAIALQAGAANEFIRVQVQPGKI